MKIDEITKEKLEEAVIHAAEIQHIRARANIVAGFCDRMGNYPLIYRAFNATTPETPIIKVTNHENKNFEYNAKGMFASSLTDIMKKLDIKNPTFCTMITPSELYLFHGQARIFVPTENYKVVWSPVVVDIGGNTVAGEDADKYGMIITGNMGHMTDDRRIPASMASTYREGLPKNFTKNELIFDCDEYYLINIGTFLKKYVGKAAKELVYYRKHKIPGMNIEVNNTFPSLKEDLFKTKFRDYKTLAWYIRNPMMNYLDWLEKIRNENR